MKWWDQMPWLVFWMLSFKPTFSLSSFTFVKRLFSSSLLSAKKVVSSMQNLKKKWHKWTYLQNRNRLADLEKDCVVTRRKQGGIVGEFGIDTGHNCQRPFCCNEHCRDLRGQRPSGPTWAGFYNLMNLMTQIGSLVGKGLWSPHWSKCAWSSQVFTRSTTATPSWIHKTPGHGATSLTCQGNVLTRWMKSPGRVINPVQQIIH